MSVSILHEITPDGFRCPATGKLTEVTWALKPGAGPRTACEHCTGRTFREYFLTENIRGDRPRNGELDRS